MRASRFHVERRGHTQRIVVGFDELRNGFFPNPSPRQESISRLQHVSECRAGNFRSAGELKFPIVLPRKQHQDVLSFPAPGTHLQKGPSRYSRSQPDNSNRMDIAQFTPAYGQSFRRNLNREVVCMPAAGKCFQKPSGLLSTSASQLAQNHVARVFATRFS